MKAIENILVPIDFSNNTEKVMETATAMAGKLGAKMHLLFVVGDFGPYSGFVIPHISTDVLAKELHTQAEHKMAAYLDEQKEAGCNCDGEIIHGDDIAQEVAAYAKGKNMDMILMGTHGYKGIEKTFMGSVAEKVLRYASCPVMVVKPG